MLSDWSPWKLYAKNNDTGNLNLFPFCALFYRKVPILCCCSLPICPRMSMSSAFSQSTPSLSASAHPLGHTERTHPPPMPFLLPSPRQPKLAFQESVRFCCQEPKCPWCRWFPLHTHIYWVQFSFFWGTAVSAKSG